MLSRCYIDSIIPLTFYGFYTDLKDFKAVIGNFSVSRNETVAQKLKFIKWRGMNYISKVQRYATRVARKASRLPSNKFPASGRRIYLNKWQLH